MENLIANDRQHGLLNHLIAVGNVAYYLAKKTELSEELCIDIRHASYLHDIGKADIAYQKFIKNIKDDFHGVHHHELSWLYLISFTTVKSSKRESFNRILNAVYWHHAKHLNDDYKSLDDSHAMLKLIDKEAVFAEIRNVVNQLKQYDNTLYIDNDEFNDELKATPSLYTSDHNRENRNAELIAIRSCVIAADRIVSKLTKEECDFIANNPNNLESIDDIKNYTADLSNCDYSVPSVYENDRFDLQDNCSNECIKNNTICVNAPAGLGKTLIGVLSVLKSKKRTIWVCPRNSVAESVFESIKKEITLLNANLSVELFIASERKNVFQKNITDLQFTSDIIVTNIDNLLKPMVSNEIADRLYYSLMSNIIFDEYHEFILESPLFASFINLMRLRHRLGNKFNTILLSATSTNMHKLWDDYTNKTIHLPNKNEHYQPAHNKLYKLEITNDDLNTLNIIPGGITIFNSIGNAQDHYIKHNTTLLAHSRFIENDKQEMLSKVFSLFGKDGTGIQNGFTVSSAPILQAAMDISFHSISESVLSPESTLQRLGRCNRWGELDSGLIRISNFINQSESSAISNMNDTKIKNLWWQFIEENLKTNEQYNIAQFYNLYNEFYKKYDSIIYNYINEAYNVGVTELQTFYPVKSPTIVKTEESQTNPKSLRTPDGSFFITVKNIDTNTWTDTNISCSSKELTSHINTFLDSDNKMFYIKQLCTNGYDYFFKYSKSKVKLPTFNEWKVLSRNRNTPIPAINYKYSKRIGIHRNK